MYRADPWLLPQRPRFGSVPAEQLAEQARTAPGALARVTAEGGTLTGRAEEYFEGVRQGEPILAALTAAGRCFEHGSRDTPKVALTFDDGPDPVHTRQVLEILERYGARATFFCVGQHVAALPDEVRRIAAALPRAGQPLLVAPLPVRPDAGPAARADRPDGRADDPGDR